MHLAVVDPAVDGEVIGGTFRGRDLHLGREPRVLGEQREALLVQLYQDQLPEGLGAVHSEAGLLKMKREEALLKPMMWVGGGILSGLVCKSVAPRSQGRLSMNET